MHVPDIPDSTIQDSIESHLVDELKEHYRVLSNYVQKFELCHWRKGNKVLSARFAEGKGSIELQNYRINNNLSSDSPNYNFVFLEIVRKPQKGPKHFARARIMIPNLSPYVESVSAYAHPKKEDVLAYMKSFPSLFDDPEAFLEKYDVVPGYNNEGYMFVSKGGAYEQSFGEEETVLNCRLSMFRKGVSMDSTPGNVQHVHTWCYDLKAESTDLEEQDCASVTLTYQYLLPNGQINPEPWQFRVKNYHAIQKNGHFVTDKTKHIADEYFSLTEEEMLALDNSILHEYDSFFEHINKCNILLAKIRNIDTSFNP